MGLGLFPEAWGRALLADGSLFSAANLITSAVPLIARGGHPLTLAATATGSQFVTGEKTPRAVT